MIKPRYLLDTNICIYIAKRRPPEVLRRFEQLEVGEVAMSVVTLGELEFGAEKSRDPSAARRNLDLLLELIPALSLSPEVAGHYGRVRLELQRAGTPIGANDLWIAAHALATDLTLVTNNEREFARIGALKMENWVVAQG